MNEWYKLYCDLKESFIVVYADKKPKLKCVQELWNNCKKNDDDDIRSGFELGMYKQQEEVD